TKAGNRGYDAAMVALEMADLYAALENSKQAPRDIARRPARPGRIGKRRDEWSARTIARRRASDLAPDGRERGARRRRRARPVLRPVGRGWQRDCGRRG